MEPCVERYRTSLQLIFTKQNKRSTREQRNILHYEINIKFLEWHPTTNLMIRRQQRRKRKRLKNENSAIKTLVIWPDATQASRLSKHNSKCDHYRTGFEALLACVRVCWSMGFLHHFYFVCAHTLQCRVYIKPTISYNEGYNKWALLHQNLGIIYGANSLQQRSILQLCYQVKMAKFDRLLDYRVSVGKQQNTGYCAQIKLKAACCQAILIFRKYTNTFC